VFADVTHDLLVNILGSVDATSNDASLDAAEQILDLVEPRIVGRREMQVRFR
jgi:hypothetical protein